MTIEVFLLDAAKAASLFVMMGCVLGIIYVYLGGFDETDQ